MLINELLRQQGISKYRLSKSSGVPQATISDICSGKARIEKCSADTLYKIAKVLNVSMESLICDQIEGTEKSEQRSSFEVFKSNVCHHVKDLGDIDFMIKILEDDEIRILYEKKWYPEAFYLLAMVDYLSRENDVPLCTKYDDIRSCKLENPIYPTGILLSAALQNSDKSEEIMEECVSNAIPEFLRFNIIESEVRNVY